MIRPALRWAQGLVLLAAVGVALTPRGRFDAATLQAWVEGAGAAGPLLFMGLYAVATVLFLPGAVLTLAGGALSGPLRGTLWNLENLTERLAEFEDRKLRPVHLICRTDRRSAQATRLLAEAGFSNAQVVRGGMTVWRAHGWAAVIA